MSDGGPAVAAAADGAPSVRVDPAEVVPAGDASRSFRAASAAVPRAFRFNSHQTMAMIKTMTMTQIIHSIAQPFIRHARLPLLDGTSVSIGLSRLVRAGFGYGRPPSRLI